MQMHKFFSSLLILAFLSGGNVYGARKSPMGKGSPATARLCKEEIVPITRITKLSQRFKDLQNKESTIITEPLETRKTYIKDLFECYQDLKRELHWKLHLAGQAFTTWIDLHFKNEFIDTLRPKLEADERISLISMNDQENIFLYEKKKFSPALMNSEPMQSLMLELINKSSATHKLLISFTSFSEMIKRNSLIAFTKSKRETLKIQKSLPKIYKEYKQWYKTLKEMDKVNPTETSFLKLSSSSLQTSTSSLQKLKAFLKNGELSLSEEFSKKDLIYYLYSLHHLLSLEMELQPQRIKEKPKFKWECEFDPTDCVKRRLCLGEEKQIGKKSDRKLEAAIKETLNVIERSERKEKRLKAHEENIRAKKQKEIGNFVITKQNSINQLSFEEIMKFLEPQTKLPEKKNTSKRPASKKSMNNKLSLTKIEEISSQSESKPEGTVIIEKPTVLSKKTKNQKRKTRSGRPKERVLATQKILSERGVEDTLETVSADIKNSRATSEILSISLSSELIEPSFASIHNDGKGKNLSFAVVADEVQKPGEPIWDESIGDVYLSQEEEIKKEAQTIRSQDLSPLLTSQVALNQHERKSLILITPPENQKEQREREKKNFLKKKENLQATYKSGKDEGATLKTPPSKTVSLNDMNAMLSPHQTTPTPGEASPPQNSDNQKAREKPSVKDTELVVGSPESGDLGPVVMLNPYVQIETLTAQNDELAQQNQIFYNSMVSYGIIIEARELEIQSLRSENLYLRQILAQVKRNEYALQAENSRLQRYIKELKNKETTNRTRAFASKPTHQ